MNKPTRLALTTVFVIVSLAAGRALTDALPTDSLTRGGVDPFIVNGTIGKSAELRYAEVTVDRIRPALAVAGINGASTTPGHFLVADLVLRVKNQPETITGLSVLARDGRVFHADGRWPIGTSPTGVPWHITAIFELPADAFEGAVLEVARSNDWWNQRRDDVLHVDLGITETEAKEFADSRDIIHQPDNGLNAPDVSTTGQVPADA